MKSYCIKMIRDLNHLIKCSADRGDHYHKKLNMTQLSIVMYLLSHEDEETCQKDFEAVLKMNKASITGALDSLQEMGVIERKVSEKDKRLKIITLGVNALKEREKIADRMKSIEAKAISGIDEADLLVFEKVVNQMTDNLEKLGGLNEANI